MRLPVGKVLDVTRITESVTPLLLKPGPAGNSSLSGAQGDPTALAHANSRRQEHVYKHRVALLSGTVREIEVDYQFAVGDCVAIRTIKQQRSMSLQIVEALPGACDQAATP
jgi:hypothetical protein